MNLKRPAVLTCALLSFAAAGLLTGCGSHHGDVASGSASALSGATSVGSATSSVVPGKPKPGKSSASAASPAPTDGEGNSSTSSGPEHCTVVSTPAVQHVIGTSASSVTMLTTGTGSPLCIFEFSKTDAGGSGSVSASVHKPETLATFESVMAQTAGAVRISGVGDDAYFDPRSSTVQFVRGSLAGYAQASLGKSADATKIRSDATAIAKAILAAQ